jgi:hypothetical protein
LEPDDVKNFLLNKNNPHFLSVIKNIHAISFEKSITMFHDLNDLILIFYEKPKELVKYTNDTTRKIYLHSSLHKNTIKNRYKD